MVDGVSTLKTLFYSDGAKDRHQHWNPSARYHDGRRLTKMTRENGLIVARAFLFPFEPVGVARGVQAIFICYPGMSLVPNFACFLTRNRQTTVLSRTLASSPQFTSSRLSPLVAAGLRNNSIHWPFLCRGGALMHLSNPKQLVCPGFTNIGTTEHEQRGDRLACDLNGLQRLSPRPSR